MNPDLLAILAQLEAALDAGHLGAALFWTKTLAAALQGAPS